MGMEKFWFSNLSRMQLDLLQPVFVGMCPETWGVVYGSGEATQIYGGVFTFIYL